MGKTKCALLDTDFISKLHITCKDTENRLIDRILELPGYQFVCHEQIATELGQHNTSASDWLQRRVAENVIQKFTDRKIIEELRFVYGENALTMYLYYLSNACSLFDSTFYSNYYAELEQRKELSDDEFAAEIICCDLLVGTDNNLGEMKTFLLQQVLAHRPDISIYIFYSDDRNARVGISVSGGVPGVSALAAFYVLKERLGMKKAEAKQYFDSWMQFHQNSNQTQFKIHRPTKEGQLKKVDGYEIFDRIYDGTIGIAKDGDLLLRCE